MNLHPATERFSRLFHERAQDPAYLGAAPASVLTWGELLAAAAGLSRHFLSQLDRQETLILACGNQLEFPVVFWAAMLCGRRLMPVSPQITWSELAPLVEQVRAGAVVGEAESLERWGGQLKKALPIEQVWQHRDAKPANRADWPGDSGSEGSIILQSSGSTGLPKLVERRFSAMEKVGQNCCWAIGIHPADRYLLAIPLYHSYAIDHGLMAAAESGCSVRLCRGFDLQRVGSALAEKTITLLPGVPFMFEVLARRDDLPEKLEGLRCVFSAGAPLPPSVHEAFAARYGRSIGQIYGSTEFGSVTFNDPAVEPFDFSSVGRPMQGVRIRITDPENPDQPLAEGQEGEISVAAPSAMSGYWIGDSGCDAEGFIRTGDLGRVDDFGRLHLTGRLKLMADVGGLKVNLMEVEGVLRSHAAVRDAVLVPLVVSPTAHRLKAWVVLRENKQVDAEELRIYLRERLTAYKVPRQIEICEDLPRSSSGKILRHELMA